MTSGTLFGSTTSPYVRMTRLVRSRSGAESFVAFEVADAWKESYRAVNPLGKVPALVLDNGVACLETTLICRTLMGIGGTDLLPAAQMERVQEEADVALMIGLLDLGVAFLLEDRRDPAEQSKTWQARRLRGIEAALPMVESAARRAARRPRGYGAIALVSALDWFSFRHEGRVHWREACPVATEVVDGLLREEDVAKTDPRNA
ncbi:glutathione S-transferase N-terminal domain-containing protein [Parvularcula lutaonensis]|uniref:Glutathione S-transferase N-terminal domain-containing protein n=1 Tax=Parvularcula lutaonensis TaxID=491923 RepID=A0ABV7M9M3_9PROT|nr:glutathione S-transferase N-terminal domain-containing protein [Parvularcula lutaonensis]GGY47421.1 glutathione S-transferase [Parvularcula lutaonensis]